MDGVIPVLSVTAKGVAEMWEKSLVKLWNWGCKIRTEYDQKDGDGNWLYPASIDATMMMTATNPSSEPAIHRAFPGGLEDLEEYRQEVVDGIKDHWVGDLSNPDDKRWEYTYHKRLTKYGYIGKTGTEVLVDGKSIVVYSPMWVDQLNALVKKLAKSPISRRVQATTWQPWEDPQHFDPPCLQSIWCRILPDKNDVWHLNMNVRFRSRDAYDAAYMNVWAFVCFQEELAKRIAEKAGREVRLGHYCDLSDSYHIYGTRQAHFIDGFLKLLKQRSFKNRTWTREFAQPFFDEAKPVIADKIRKYDEKKKKEVENA